MADTTSTDELEEYDSLELNPVINNGVAGDVEKILRGFEPVADGHRNPIGFDLYKDLRTEFGFYWEFEDMADAASKIAIFIHQKQLEAREEIARPLAKYFSLKDESKQLKRHRQSISSKVGKCESGPQFGPCYLEDRLLLEDYCAACQAKDSISKEIQSNSRIRVGILNSLRAQVQNINKDSKS